MTTTANPPTDEKLNFKRVLPIFVIVLIDLLGLTIIIPLLPLYAVSFGADPFTVGLIGSTYPLMQLIGGPVLGGLSDRYGRKPVLIISQIGTLFGFILLAVSNSLALIFVSRIIDGLSGANIVAAQAAMTDSTTEKTRTQGLGLIGAAFGLGFVLGPAISGIALALSGNDYRVPALIAAAFSLLSILLTAFWFNETLPAARRGAAQGTGSKPALQRVVRAITNPLVGMLLILMFLQQIVFGGYENLFSLFSLTRLGLNAAGNSLIFVFMGIIIVLVQGKYIGPLSRKYGEHKLIWAALGLLAIGLVLTSITPQQPVPWYSRAELAAELNERVSIDAQTASLRLPEDDANGWFGLAWILVASVPAVIGGGLLAPSLNSLITRRSPASETGSILGVSASLVSAANAITPIAGGALFQIFGSTAPFLIGGLGMAALMFLALRVVQPLPETETVAT